MWLFVILVAPAVLLAASSWRGERDRFRYYRERLRDQTQSAFLPPVSLIVPVKGHDQGLQENLASLAGLDYPDYELIIAARVRCPGPGAGSRRRSRWPPPPRSRRAACSGGPRQSLPAGRCADGAARPPAPSPGHNRGSRCGSAARAPCACSASWAGSSAGRRCAPRARRGSAPADRKSTRLNSSHVEISYAVFCLKKKIKQ